MKISGIKTAALGAAMFAMMAPVAQAQDFGVELVVVTAQRKEQRLVDVPISVGVISGDAFRNANFANITDLAFIAPSVTYNTNFGGGFEIRGVGTQSVTTSIEQSVSVVVDDMVKGLPEIQFAGPSYQALTDVERIEVLRGPQGTLFGKNSAAGVIQVITKRPEIGKFGADGSLSYGTANETKVAANVNIPLNDEMAARVGFFRNSRDGYIRNVYTNQNLSGYTNWGFRGKLLWQPIDKFEAYLIANFAKNYDNGNGIWTVRSCGTGFACGTLAPYGVTASPTNLSGAWDGPIYARSESKDISARFSYDLGFGTLKAITAYQTIDLDEAVEVDSTPRPVLSINTTIMDERQLTQEIRLEGTAWDDRIDYTVGGFYYDASVLYLGLQAGTFGITSDASAANTVLTSGVGGPIACCETVNLSQTTSYAFFGQASITLFEGLFREDDKFVLTGGARYTNDENSVTITTTSNARSYPYNPPNICQLISVTTGAPCKPANLGSVVSRSITADNISGKVTAQYYFMPEANIYATYATGYKGPSVSYPRGLPLVGVNPETVESWEIGMKGNFFNNMLYLAVNYFHSTYTDFQGQALYTDPTNPGNRAYVTTNAGGLKTSGIELDVQVRPTEELSFSFGYTYAPTEFISFGIPCANLYTNPATPKGQCNFPNQGLVQFNAAGYPLTYAPENVFTIAAAWNHDLSEDYRLRVTGNYRWQDQIYTVVADPNSIAPGYGLLGMTIGIGAADESWMLSVFARNLLDDYFVSGIFKTSLDGSASPAGCDTNPALCTTRLGYANIPSVESRRTVGVKLDVKIGD